MRKKDREICDLKVIESIVCRANVCRLAMCEEGLPYVVLYLLDMRREPFIFIRQLLGKSWRFSRKIPRSALRWTSIENLNTLAGFKRARSCSGCKSFLLLIYRSSCGS
jgi:nitroimidazol reductase NimA-like FMN-containing flavoprotein (pyridoxamine 5'-phosphate oxidase superfamily)